VGRHGPTRPPYPYGPGSFEAPPSFSYDDLSEIFRSVFRFEGKIDEIRFCLKFKQCDVIMTSNYVIVSIELSLDFGKCVMSSFEVIEIGGSEGPPGRRKQKSPV